MELAVAEVVAVAGTVDVFRLHLWHRKDAEADKGPELDNDSPDKVILSRVPNLISSDITNKNRFIGIVPEVGMKR